MTEATITVTLTASEMNAIIACLHDVDDIRRSPEADELLRDATADYTCIGGVADKLEKALKPSWNPDEI